VNELRRRHPALPNNWQPPDHSCGLLLQSSCQLRIAGQSPCELIALEISVTLEEADAVLTRLGELRGGRLSQ
jgi:hypothetical protein